MAGREVIPGPEILEGFGLNSEDWICTSLERGHINSSIILSSKAEGKAVYLLQKVNSYVFPRTKELMRNMVRVTEAIREANIKEGLDPDRYGLHLAKALDGRYYVEDSDGAPWRLLNYISGHKVYDVVTDENIAREGGKAYGKFLKLLSVIPAEELEIVIDRFHDLEYRFEQFTEALAGAAEDRISNAAEEIAETKRQWDRFKDSAMLDRKGRLPLRITHNDTKFNNLLFDLEGKALCVVDLDTVMPGLLHYDFGDAIRTVAASAPEDVENTEEMKFVFELFAAFASGYLSEVGGIIEVEEAESLYLAPPYFAFIMGLRFLTDFLAGDKYFKIQHKKHNLQRVRAQYTLMREMQKVESRMREEIMASYRLYL